MIIQQNSLDEVAAMCTQAMMPGVDVDRARGDRAWNGSGAPSIGGRAAMLGVVVPGLLLVTMGKLGPVDALGVKSGMM